MVKDHPAAGGNVCQRYGCTVHCDYIAVDGFHILQQQQLRSTFFGINSRIRMGKHGNRLAEFQLTLLDDCSPRVMDSCALGGPWYVVWSSCWHQALSMTIPLLVGTSVAVTLAPLTITLSPTVNDLVGLSEQRLRQERQDIHQPCPALRGQYLHLGQAILPV